MLLSAVAFQSFAADSGSIGDSITWEITDDGELIIEGTGAIPDSASESPWIAYALDIYSLTIGEGITSIGQYAFRGLESILDVEMADTVTSIGYGAFDGCSCIESIELSENLVSIGREAFNGCTALEEVVAGDKLVSVGTDAFKDTAIVSKAKNSLVYVGSVVVTYKGSMPSNTVIELREGTVGIADSAFKNQASLISVTFPDSMLHIGDEAFFGCGNLTEPVFNEGLEYIGEMAYYSSTGFDKVTIPQSVTTIGDKAFGWLKDPAWGDKKSASFTVIGYSGTAAETYANSDANGFTFTSLGEIEPPAPSYAKGDVNMDGNVTARDILAIKRHIVSAALLSDEAKVLADVDEDGRINAKDILRIKRTIVGIND
jgi:hypothetical protein